MGFGWIRDPIYYVMRPTQTLPDGAQISFFGAATAGLRGAGPVLPYWFLVMFTSAMGGLVFVKWPPRFSLRGLFFAVSIVALILGLEMSFR